MRVPLAAACALSAVAHAAALVALPRLPVHPEVDSVSLDIVEVVRPAPPPEEPPAPRAPALAPPRAAPRAPSPAPSPPPPPNAPPPEQAPPPSPRAPVRIGVSLSSTTTSGGVAAPVGNTLYGELPRRAPDPAEVRPYRSDRYVPPTQVTVLPRPIGECRPPTEEYPEAALRLGIEGLVILVLTVDERGEIADGRVVEDPGHGLGPAALASVRKHCRFAPARRGGEAVATRFRYKVRFELP